MNNTTVNHKDPPVGNNHPLILIVDDDAIVRALAQDALENNGFRTVEAGDCASAADCFHRLSPTAVLLDVVLPDGNGFNLCQALRQADEGRYTPIIMMTALEDLAAIEKAFDAGATDFCSKPVNWFLEVIRLRHLLRAADAMQQRHKTQEMLRSAKHEWERTFDSIGDAVLLVDRDRTIMRANVAAASMAQMEVRDLIGKPCPSIFCVSRTDASECTCHPTLERGVAGQSEAAFGPKQHACQISTFPVLNGSDHPKAIVCTARDVTDYREMERELRHAQKMEAVGVLAAGIAHDFNNLLQSIIGLSELLALKEDLTGDIREGLSEITKIAQTGKSLTRQLLMTSRKVEAKKAPLDLQAVVRRVVGMLERTIPKTVRIETRMAADLWRIDADSEQLEQVVMNLIINASQAMPEGGQIGIGLSNVALDEDYCLRHPDIEPGPHILLAVSDTGQGIERGHIHRIFEPFFTTKEVGKGTGLGLSVVYGIVKGHDGHIDCYSEMGRGTTLKIYFPSVEREIGKHDVEAGQDTRQHGRGNGETILVAEDEQVILRMLQILLETHGYKVIATHDGAEALEIYRQKSGEIAAIVLDMNMPRMDGETCLLELIKLGCRAPVILATGALLNAERESDLLRHSAGIIMKPYSCAMFLKTIATALSGADRGRRAEEIIGL